MSYLGIFDQKCLILVFLGRCFKTTIVIFEISTLKFVYLQNVTRKQNFQNLGPKMPDLGIFVRVFYKTILIVEINILNFVRNESLTYAMNFGIGSTFFKGLGFAFSEGPGLGPLYKVCQLLATFSC